MPPLIASELKEIKLTQLELKVQQSLQLQEIKSSLQMQQSLQLQEIKSSLQKQQSLQLQEIKSSLQMQQSLQLQEIKSSLQSLERTVMNLSEKSKKRSASDVIDVESLSSFSSNPPSESSAFLPPAFGSPPFFPTSPSSSLNPTIPSLSGKQMRASSAPPTCRYFQQDCRGGASCWSGDSCPQSGGVLELEGGIPSTRDETLTSSDGNYPAVSWSATTGSQLFNQGATPQFRDGMPSQNMLGQPVECESPTQGASVILARLVNKFTPISPTKYKSSDEVPFTRITKIPRTLASSLSL